MLLSCCSVALLCNLNRKGRMNTCVLSLYPEIMKWLRYINQMRPECCFHCCCCDYLCESMYLTYLMYLTSTSIDATNHSPCPVGATAEWLSRVLSAPTKETWTASLLSAHLKHFLLPSKSHFQLSGEGMQVKTPGVLETQDFRVGKWHWGKERVWPPEGTLPVHSN